MLRIRTQNDTFLKLTIEFKPMSIVPIWFRLNCEDMSEGYTSTHTQENVYCR